jgi:hypothetical protein
MAYGYHPFSEVYPLLEGPAYDDFANDIAANGLAVAILLYQGKIIDGRNRDKACAEAGVEPRYEEATCTTDEEAIKLVLSLNSHRRHLSDDQLKFAAARLANLKHGQNAGQSEISKEISEQTNVIPMSRAAELMKQPVAEVKKARAVQEHAPELEKEVSEGRMTLGEASTIAFNKARPQKEAARNDRDTEVVALKRKGRTNREIAEKVGIAPSVVHGILVKHGLANTTTEKRGGTSGLPKPPKSAKAEARKAYDTHRDGLKKRELTREEVDPEFTGTPLEFTGKYGHCPQRTARELARDGAKEWSFVARKMVSDFQKQPELKPVDLNWLRDPLPPAEDARLVDALAVLGPIVDHLRAIRAKSAVLKDARPTVVNGNGKAGDDVPETALAIP